MAMAATVSDSDRQVMLEFYRKQLQADRETMVSLMTEASKYENQYKYYLDNMQLPPDALYIEPLFVQDDEDQEVAAQKHELLPACVSVCVCVCVSILFVCA